MCDDERKVTPKHRKGAVRASRGRTRTQNVIPNEEMQREAAGIIQMYLMVFPPIQCPMAKERHQKKGKKKEKKKEIMSEGSTFASEKKH